MKVINEYVSERCAIYNGDSAEVMCKLPDNSMDYSIFSPPFEDLYTYSDSDRDLGNCRSTNEFYEQFGFIVEELFNAKRRHTEYLPKMEMTLPSFLQGGNENEKLHKTKDEIK